MAVLVLGGGLAGLACAIDIKLRCRAADVTILNHGVGNSYLAGQRFRTRGARGLSLEQTLAETSRRPSEGIGYFAAHAQSALSFWTQFDARAHGITQPIAPLTQEDRPEWFGPQWGRACEENEGLFQRGADVIGWFRHLASLLEIRQLEGRVLGLNRDQNLVRSLSTKDATLHADYFVLAAGNPGGRMFHSTNARIAAPTSQELALDIGLPLIDHDLFMMHPFARVTGAAGENLAGCHETDALAGGIVRLPDETGAFSITDDGMTDLLARHAAHDHMEDICLALLRKSEGRAQITMPNGKIFLTKVAHHFSHIGLETQDGVRATGMDNLWAVGDAAGTGYWTGHAPRLPGVALTACLVSAARAAKELSALPVALLNAQIESASCTHVKRPSPAAAETKLRAINTDALFQLYGGDAQAKTNWIKNLETLAPEMKENALFRLSLLTAQHEPPATT